MLVKYFHFNFGSCVLLFRMIFNQISMKFIMATKLEFQCCLAAKLSTCWPGAWVSYYDRIESYNEKLWLYAKNDCRTQVACRTQVDCWTQFDCRTQVKLEIFYTIFSSSFCTILSQKRLCNYSMICLMNVLIVDLKSIVELKSFCNFS